jgi:hypothetical protein
LPASRNFGFCLVDPTCGLFVEGTGLLSATFQSRH